MKTLVITIDKLADGGYPVSVYFDDGSTTWTTAAKRTGAIGRGLATPPYPKDGDDQPLPPDAIVKFLQIQDRPSALFQTIGEHLWSLLAQGAVGDYLADTWAAHARANARDGREGIRTILDIRPTELRALPWELMIRDNVPLFAAPLNPVVRGPLVTAVPPAADGFLLRVLVIIGSKPGDAAVQAEEEIDQLEDAARNFRRFIDLRVERPASRAALATSYREFMPHVLHFTGHGGQVKRASRPPVASLVFHDAKGARWDWAASDIRATLAVGAPRLAFLNACRSGVAEARHIVGAISDEFLAAGTLGVVAMQADIAGVAAAEFSGAAYAALALEQPLDVAMAEARYAVREREGMADRRDWCLPALNVSVNVTHVLPARLQLSADRRAQLDATPEFAAIQAFVDRRDQRLQVDPMALRPAAADVLIVKGPPSTGKTAMLLWFLEGCAWCDHRIKYVDLKRDKPGFLDVLDWIRRAETNPFSELRQALTGNFVRFDQLATVIRQGHPAAAAGTPDDPIDSMFGAFRTALVESAHGSSVLVVALDHVGSMDPDAFRNYLRPYLLDHVAQHRLQPVRFVLCCTDDEYRDLKIKDLAPAEIIKVSNFAVGDFPTLFREFLLCRKIPRQRIPAPPLMPKGEWPPKMLHDVYELLDKYGQLGD